MVFLGRSRAGNGCYRRGDDAVDLNFNWYGNLFNKNVLVNAFRNHGGSFDVEAGYSHALFDHALDLRLKFAGYQFDVGNAVYGWRGGADLTTRDGMFTLRYEYGKDRLNGSYNTVGGFVNVGFQLENLFSGESPFMMPEPVFRSPRALRRLLGLKVKRNWHQPSAVAVSRAVTPGCDALPYRVDSPPYIKGVDPFYSPSYTLSLKLDPLDRDGENVRVRWCGYSGPLPALVSFTWTSAQVEVSPGFWSSTNQEVAVYITATSGTTTTTVSATVNSLGHPFGPPPDGVTVVFFNLPAGPQFAPGGGISFDFE